MRSDVNYVLSVKEYVGFRNRTINSHEIQNIW